MKTNREINYIFKGRKPVNIYSLVAVTFTPKQSSPIRHKLHRPSTGAAPKHLTAGLIFHGTPDTWIPNRRRTYFHTPLLKNWFTVVPAPFTGEIRFHAYFRHFENWAEPGRSNCNAIKQPGGPGRAATFTIGSKFVIMVVVFRSASRECDNVCYLVTAEYWMPIIIG